MAANRCRFRSARDMVLPGWPMMFFHLGPHLQAAGPVGLPSPLLQHAGLLPATAPATAADEITPLHTAGEPPIVAMRQLFSPPCPTFLQGIIGMSSRLLEGMQAAIEFHGTFPT